MSAPLVPTVALAPGYVIPRIIKGGWQLAGGHGAVEDAAAMADMFAYAEAGITAFDCADIYTGVEERIGAFLRAWWARHGETAPRIRVHTKCVPDLDTLPTLTRADLARTIDRSRARLGVETLDLVQFHWWDYAVPGMEEALHHLDALRREGKIAQLGLTNTDTPHLRAFLDAGIPIVSHQVQLSLLDRRPLGAMATLCRERGVSLLCYGALAGGFFHERWLGASEPADPLENRSLVKYKLIIDECGGWDRFQALLALLARLAEPRGATIGAVAIRAVLDEPAVGAVIAGARHARHLAATVAACTMAPFTAAERGALDALLAEAPGPAGDVYTLERDRTGRHGAIMRYNLNAGRQAS